MLTLLCNSIKLFSTDSMAWLMYSRVVLGLHRIVFKIRRNLAKEDWISITLYLVSETCEVVTLWFCATTSVLGLSRVENSK